MSTSYLCIEHLFPFHQKVQHIKNRYGQEKSISKLLNTETAYKLNISTEIVLTEWILVTYVHFI